MKINHTVIVFSREELVVEKDGILEVKAVCVVSKARGTARSGKIFRTKALAVKQELRGRGLAAKALKRLQVELGWTFGIRYCGLEK